MNRSNRTRRNRKSVRQQLCVERFEDRVLLATWTVTNTLDSGGGSLREAISLANTQPGSTIDFDFEIVSPSYSINLATPLPALNVPTVIDGTLNQPGYAGSPIIQIDGGGLNADGLLLAPGSDGSTVKGLAFVNFGEAGIHVQSNNSIIVANYLGTDVTGTASGVGNGIGIFVETAGGNTIGGVGSLGNLISGNGIGVRIYADPNLPAPSGNTILGNLIGTDRTGMAALGNTFDGIQIESSNGNMIGGTAPGATNVISANGNSGINILSGSNTLILGNYIGTDASGNAALGNIFDGITDFGSENTIGSDAGAGNLISGNQGYGINLFTSQDVILGNRIGTNAAGTAAVGNLTGGISDSGSNNTIGGTTLDAQNVISGNQGMAGIYLSFATGAQILGNVIGATPGDINAPTNFQPLGNQGFGIVLFASSNVTIGQPGAGNLIVSNGQSGINIDLFSYDNIVSGNGIGAPLVASSGIGINEPPVNLGNAGDGILLTSTSGNTIGGSTLVGANGKITSLGGNVISSNGQYGIEIQFNNPDLVGQPNYGNLVVGNLIGTNALGNASTPNGFDGILVGNSAQNTLGGVNTVNADGTVSVLNGNLISGNKGSGLTLNGSLTTETTVLGNRIGTNLAGKAAIANGKEGLRIYVGAKANLIGGTAAGSANLVSGNATGGITISDGGTTGNQLIGNVVGLDSTGITTLPNLGDGVLIRATGNAVGGTTQGSGNVISGNLGAGVRVANGANQNQILGNLIGLDVNGIASGVGNVQSGIEINSANNTTIGGLAATAGNGPGNVISGNRQTGIHITGTSTSTLIQGNIVGLDRAGTAHQGNSLFGIWLDGVSGTTIGGNQAGAANVLSNNGTAGLAIENGSTNNLVQGNLIGSDLTGLLAMSPIQNGVIIVGSSGNTIGGTNFSDGNVISGNGLSGVTISGNAASGNLIQGNRIGTDRSGTLPLANGQDGVFIDSAVSNTVGGAAPGAGNLISANRSHGVHIRGTSNTPQQNLVEGNRIGTNAAGTGSLGNGVNGVFLAAGAIANIIGRSTTGAGNLISGNQSNGVELFSTATGNLVQGNRIGTDVSGSFAVGNNNAGVYSNNASGNTIGGPTVTTGSLAGNLISGNNTSGILIAGTGSGSNFVQGNAIGTNASLNSPLSNMSAGITIDGSLNNLIGGGETGAGNLIAANRTYGVLVLGPTATGNQLAGNWIGTNASGAANLGNALDGVILNSAPANTVGGISAGDRNVISGNAGNGLQILNIPGTDGVAVLGNLIGTDPTGTRALGNGLDGILLNDVSGTMIAGAALPNVVSGNKGNGVRSIGSSSRALIQGNLIGTDASGSSAISNGGNAIAFQDIGSNIVGGQAAGQGNILSGNVLHGIQIIGPNSNGNVIVGNTIGTNADGTAPVGNGAYGISIESASSTSVLSNLISGNGTGGIQITGTDALGNLIYGNTIGTDRSGSSALGNGLASQNNGNGIFINGSSANRIGGSGSGQGNLISGNGTTGIYIFGRFASGNTVQGNRIGTDASGLRAFVQSDTSLIQQVGVLINQAPGNDVQDLKPGPGNTIGGTSAGEGNLISGNTIGIEISGAESKGNLVSGNIIGPSANGGAGVGNSIGVYINGAPGNVIGGPSGNFISGNSSVGVYILGNSSTGNQVTGNVIGLGFEGLQRLPNQTGVYIENAPRNFIGGTTTTAQNVISANVVAGVYIVGSQSVGNVVKGNLIGYASNGTTRVGNGQYGVLLYNAANNTVIRRGRNTNRIAGSGIANFREYTGRPVSANAPLGKNAVKASAVSVSRANQHASTRVVVGASTPRGPGGRLARIPS